MNIRIYNYNNYYNRIVKKLTTSSPEYGEYIYESLATNWNPNDEIETEHIFGNHLTAYDGSGDYLICIDSNNNIVSRWFIIECIRERGGQWRVQLRRDLIVDYYDDIINADVYIEKAILDESNKLIYNSENFQTNQIKRSQTAIKDRTETAWLVGYLAPNAPAIPIEASKKIEYQYAVDGIQNFELYRYSNLGTEKIYSDVASLVLGVNVNNPGTFSYAQYVLSILNPGRPQVIEDYGTRTMNQNCELSHLNTEASYAIAEKIYGNTNRERVSTIMLNSFPNVRKTNESITKYSNMIIKDTVTNKYYRCVINTASGDSTKLQKNVVPTSSEDLNLLPAVLGSYTTNVQNDRLYIDNQIIRPKDVNTAFIPAFELNVYAKEYIIELEEVENSSSTGSIPTSARIPYDSPYKIFCMPYYPNNRFIFKYNGSDYIMDSDVSMSVMTKLISDQSGGSNPNLLDAQILPYCPLQKFIRSDGKFDLNNSVSSDQQSLEGIDYIILKDNSGETPKITGFMAFCDNASFNFTIEKPFAATFNLKITAECYKYRLCSPNFNGVFDFNIGKLGGWISNFNVSCTYKPHQPYIKVAPNFSNSYGIYGGNFKDPRGLICGGEFGLPLLGDAWATYERQNKNYLNSFNRQIETMEISQEVEREKQLWQIATGSVTGAVSGAGSAAIASGGNPYAAIAGGIIGGATSTAGGIRDFQLGEKLRNEALDYTRDQFNYSLQNIQALPYSLTRVSALNNDFTYFPILEVYRATDEEIQALANKIAYTSMTVMTIGKLKDYIGKTWSFTGQLNGKAYTVNSKGYIKGKLIRMEGLGVDFHIINAISGELDKGVYIP